MSEEEMFWKFKKGLKDSIKNELERRFLPKDLKTWQ
jgi:hypothetical protein